MIKLSNCWAYFWAYLRTLLVLIWLAITAFLIMILALLRWGDSNLNWYFARIFSAGALPLMGVKIQVDGLENREAHLPAIYVANHQTAFDVVTFGSIGPKRTVIVGKKELFWIPFYGLLFAACGNIMIDRSKRTQAISQLSMIADEINKKRISVWAFPEGTRNRTSQALLPFKKGAFLMAIRADVPVIPVVSGFFRDILPTKRGLKKTTLKMRFLAPIFPNGFSEKNADQLAAHTRSVMLVALRELNH